MTNLYSTEAGMKTLANSDIDYNAATELASTLAQINSGNLSAADKATAQQYASTLQSQISNGTAGATTTGGLGAFKAGISDGPTPTSGSSSDPLGLQSTATSNFLNTGKTGGPIDATNTSSSISSFLGVNLGNIGLVALGLVVIAVALIASTQSKTMILQAAAGAAIPGA